MKNEQIVRRVWKLKEYNMKAKFQERVEKLVDVDAPDIHVCNDFTNGILKACDKA